MEDTDNSVNKEISGTANSYNENKQGSVIKIEVVFYIGGSGKSYLRKWHLIWDLCDKIDPSMEEPRGRVMRVVSAKVVRSKQNLAIPLSLGSISQPWMYILNHPRDLKITNGQTVFP